MSEAVHIPVDLIESATVLASHRARPGRCVAAFYRDDEWSFGLIGRRIGLKGEKWTYCTPLDAHLEAASAGMCSHRNVQGPLLRETVAEFRARHGYELPVTP